MLQYRQIQW